MLKVTILVLGLIASLCVVSISGEPAAVSRRFPKHGARIIKGDTSKRDQFPYMAYINSFNTTFKWRAGVLISSNYVLSAAHTIINVPIAVVYLGLWNITNVREEGPQVRVVTSEDILLHPQYDDRALYNDIAIIKFKYPAQFTEHVQPIPLPKISATSLNLVGRKAYAAGWGRTSEKGPKSDVIKYIEIDIIENSQCLDDDVQDTNICISTIGGRSTCYGDSGGPLVIKNGSQDVLIGITSRGTNKNCAIEKPAVFTRITSYLDWIKNNTNSVNFNDIV